MPDKSETPPAPRTEDYARLLAGTHPDPFSVLGPHEIAGHRTVTVLIPGARSVSAIRPAAPPVDLPSVAGAEGLFSGPIGTAAAYKLRATTPEGHSWEFEDPYSFASVLGPVDERRIADGTHGRLWDVLGAHPMMHQGREGTHFAVRAPAARRVSVVGAFNAWDGRRHPMRRLPLSGIWEIFVPGIGEGEAYMYEILGPDGALLPLKADPFGFGATHPPETASVVRDIRGYGWDDAEWRDIRAARNDRAAPISIYEVHLASWRRKAEGRPISYREAAEELVTYAAEMGFTHIELMPISEHPFDGSWGYQPVGLFAPTIRHGPPHEFRDLVDAAHRAGLGVILDWVPGHFPTDPHGLGCFDGTPLYEYADPREGFHQDWNTLIYDYGKPWVKDVLVSNALFWLEEYHADGLRVDAVASMLYRDYSRKPGEWIPNADGGRENYEAMDVLRAVNTATYGTHPGTMTIAEESTAFPKVSAPVFDGGLGFGFKWNMGWMNDTLDYIRADPGRRRDRHHRMTFGLTYAFSENFVLPISHDEVVHGKGSMLGKMPGEREARLAGLRAYYGFMWGHPGKKLLFMGQELAQPSEWDHDGQIDWNLLDDPDHAGVQRLVRDLNALYRATPALHRKDCEADGFQWLEADDVEGATYAWIRRGGAEDGNAVIVCNFSTSEYRDYRIGLPYAGTWTEALNTDATTYGGAGRDNGGTIHGDRVSHQGQLASASIRLPPLSTVFFTTVT
ncbi:1,4-alpha-glucan branching protein GlgB [Jannaschia aquimarina]|uniref:1,4-alpha-glucan branching enzyme GlgB n=1 Tax=Jannaschia aquimarina TaxID=935700 RepID=A0A0D1EIB4_9RHOB|nr:1,4-alpha-glucan branching protein GlgB [Jannaschia aquimarina]KIT16656.1 1,4-alpha-glucan branching enzyme GlgB [Jannaschia aquimarina]SNS93167.1 1,4-alpha-glucan branching enzyme [Jannaschia aquimarina]